MDTQKAIDERFSQKESSVSRVIILDTNILIYAGNEPTEKAFIDLIHDLSKESFELVISKYSHFEILKGSSSKNEKKLIKILNLFKSLEVTDKILVTAGIMQAIYTNERVQRKIEDGDLIISSTAFLNNSLLLTANRLDFPYPFFKEIRVNPILYQSMDIPGVTKTLTAFLLKPDIDLITKKLNEKIKS